MIEKLESIADRCLSIPTLATRYSDSLDFHDVAVWSVKDALLESYKSGLEDQATALGPRTPPLFWGNSLAEFVWALKHRAFSHDEIHAAVKSFGVSDETKAVSIHCHQTGLKGGQLDAQYISELRGRIQLYRYQT